ncbi:phosphatidylglycerophosphatase A [Desulfonauticus submarinus]|uniref:Phosphatidylglycerophosphatase A n=1 Tax=Desulfonauticus submarinus TaxID=206665 RepID=A0A1H0FPM6_9BACT|nr:phosphatidylglycerophosphatase A [Desulfonauticus submarinus]SDN96429.1 phosphatidylglycerophosphatase A [Desulfonauticus submarinus]
MFRIYYYFSSAGPLGFSPIAPGTVGSLLSIFFLFLFPNLTMGIKLIISTIIFVLGAKAASEVEKKLKKQDPSLVVIDEIGGQLLTFLFITKLNILTLAEGFFIFRALDILKPWPISWAEKLPAGIGIMADDYVAGLIGSIILFGMYNLL